MSEEKGSDGDEKTKTCIRPKEAEEDKAEKENRALKDTSSVLFVPCSNVWNKSAESEWQSAVFVSIHSLLFPLCQTDCWRKNIHHLLLPHPVPNPNMTPPPHSPFTSSRPQQVAWTYTAIIGELSAPGDHHISFLSAPICALVLLSKGNFFVLFLKYHFILFTLC